MDREAFEAWHSLVHAPGYPQMVSMKNPDGTYVYIESEWKAWQAATLAERERAAKVCEENQVAHNTRNGYHLLPFAKECEGRHDGMAYAAAIRG